MQVKGYKHSMESASHSGITVITYGFITSVVVVCLKPESLSVVFGALVVQLCLFVCDLLVNLLFSALPFEQTLCLSLLKVNSTECSVFAVRVDCPASVYHY